MYIVSYTQPVSCWTVISSCCCLNMKRFCSFYLSSAVRPIVVSVLILHPREIQVLLWSVYRHQDRGGKRRERIKVSYVVRGVYWWNGDLICKGDWDVFLAISRAKTSDRDLSRRNILTALKMRSIWCILFLNRIGPPQDIRHSPQKIHEVVPGFIGWKLSPPNLAMIWRGVRCRQEYHQNDRLEKAVKKVPPWKIPIGRLCPRNCQKPS